MKEDLISIDELTNLLHKGPYSCVLTNGEKIFTSKDRGIKPLISLIEEHDKLGGYVAADIIVGKAAAMLYVKLGIKFVYGEVMSKKAVEIFEKHGVSYRFSTLVEVIINRQGTDVCPMDKTVMNIDDIEEGYLALKNKIKEINI